MSQSNDDNLPTTQEKIDDAVEMYEGGHYTKRDILLEYDEIVADLAIERVERSSEDTRPVPGTSDDYDVKVADEVELERRELNVASDDNPLAQLAGHTGSIKSEIDTDKAHDMFADQIYSGEDAVAREYLQNAETACLRAARLLLRHHADYGVEWLTRSLLIDSVTGETIRGLDEVQSALTEYVDCQDVRIYETPQHLHHVVQAARELGYDPTIEVTFHRDDMDIIIEDNGIGMTATEVKEIYNNTLVTGVLDDADTGGKMGIGNLTFVNFTGKEGGMLGWTRSRREDADNRGVHFYKYLGGMDPLDWDHPDDFYGTKFKIPVQSSVSTGSIQNWFETYGKHLRVPVLYREMQGGETQVKEEYGGEAFAEKYSDAPIIVDRPGEFTVISGPNTPFGGYKADNTWLVSMPIERNASTSVRSFWSAGIQIHNEQGLIVAGPNRGKLQRDLDELHEDDVPLPQPTTDRDRLQSDEANRRFFDYLNDVLESEENRVIKAIAEGFATESPLTYLREEMGEDDWQLLIRMIDYKGSYHVLDAVTNIMGFITDHEAFPDYDEATLDQLRRLFSKVSYAGPDTWNPSTKGNRSTKRLGEVLLEATPEHTFMAASTGGNFERQLDVVYNTYDDAAVIVIDSAAQYEKYEALGLQKLKEVPLERSADHDFEVPDDVHEYIQNRKAKRASQGISEKPEDALDQYLSFRTDSRNGIDHKITVENLIDMLDDGGIRGYKWDNHSYIIAYDRSPKTENLSDNYHMAKYAAITSVTNEQYEMLKDFPQVFTHEEFIEWSATTPVATTDEPMTLREFAALDGSSVLLKGDTKRYVLPILRGTDKLAERLRETVLSGLPSNMTKESIPEDEREEGDDAPTHREVPVFLGTIGSGTNHKRAKHFIRQNYMECHDIRKELHGVHFNRYDDFGYSIATYRMRIDFEKMKQQCETPNWSNDSNVYEQWSGLTEQQKELYLFCHDHGIDPTDIDREDLRDRLHGLLGSVAPPRQ